MPNESSFLFLVCQVGAEPALKKELAREHPELKFAFSRPGFLTFKKSDGPVPPDFRLNSVFARAYGVSLGKIGGSKEGPNGPPEAALATWVRETFSGELAQDKRLRLHLWERDLHPPGEEPKGYMRGPSARAAEARVRKLLGEDVLLPGGVAAQGDLVLDVVMVEADQWWMGAHIHDEKHSAFAGGWPLIELPQDAPSRAYVKLEEAILWSGAPVLAGQRAIEVGSAPGGASYSLLKRGLHVIGIDPAEMDPGVMGHPRFTHVKAMVNTVLRESLPEEVHWFLLDMNVEPRFTIFAVDRLVSRMMDSLHGVILTVKLNNWEMAKEIPSILEHVQAMGMVKLKAAQLAHHRQEIVIYGLTRRGQIGQTGKKIK